MAEDRRDDLNFLGALGLITVGAIIGAGVALLLAPKTGEETREMLREKGAELARRAQERGEEVARRAQETMGEAGQRAQEYLGRGREMVEEKSAQLRAAFEAGRSAMRGQVGQDDRGDRDSEYAQRQFREPVRIIQPGHAAGGHERRQYRVQQQIDLADRHAEQGGHHELQDASHARIPGIPARPRHQIQAVQ